MISVSNTETKPLGTAKDKDKDKEDEEETPAINKERAKHPDPVCNGGITDQYSWTQTLKDFTLTIPVDDDTKSKQIQLD